MDGRVCESALAEGAAWFTAVLIAGLNAWLLIETAMDADAGFPSEVRMVRVVRIRYSYLFFLILTIINPLQSGARVEHRAHLRNRNGPDRCGARQCRHQAMRSIPRPAALCKPTKMAVSCSLRSILESTLSPLQQRLCQQTSRPICGRSWPHGDTQLQSFRLGSLADG